MALEIWKYYVVSCNLSQKTVPRLLSPYPEPFHDLYEVSSKFEEKGTLKDTFFQEVLLKLPAELLTWVYQDSIGSENFLPDHPDSLFICCPEVRKHQHLRQVALPGWQHRSKEAVDNVFGNLCTDLQVMLSCLG